jgi:hypothetical protein
MSVETAAYSEQTDLQRDITEMVRQFAVRDSGRRLS